MAGKFYASDLRVSLHCNMLYFLDFPRIIFLESLGVISGAKVQEVTVLRENML